MVKTDKLRKAQAKAASKSKQELFSEKKVKQVGLPNLNYKLMEKICAMPSKGFEQFGVMTQTYKGNTKAGKYYFQDNNAKVLMVVHLDSRLPCLHFNVARLSHDHKIF